MRIIHGMIKSKHIGKTICGIIFGVIFGGIALLSLAKAYPVAHSADLSYSPIPILGGIIVSLIGFWFGWNMKMSYSKRKSKLDIGDAILNSLFKFFWNQSDNNFSNQLKIKNNGALGL